MANIAIRYVGLKDEFFDHLYGSGVTWKKGEVQPVPDWAAEKLLRHPEFEDGRRKQLAGTPIVPESQPKKKETEEQEAPLVSLEAMTKEAIAKYAYRYFGVEIPQTVKKEEMIGKVRSAMGGTPKHIL